MPQRINQLLRCPQIPKVTYRDHLPELIIDSVANASKTGKCYQFVEEADPHSKVAHITPLYRMISRTSSQLSRNTYNYGFRSTRANKNAGDDPRHVEEA